MTLRLTELEEFVEKLLKTGQSNWKKHTIRKGIEKYWDVASQHSVDQRWKALERHNFIQPSPEAPNIFKLQIPEDDELDEILSE